MLIEIKKNRKHLKTEILKREKNNIMEICWIGSFTDRLTCKCGFG